MAKILVKFQANWADEMDLEGYRIFTEHEWEEQRAACMAHKGSIEVYFGTNEWNNYDNGEHLLGEYTIKSITDEEADMIDKLFGPYIGSFSNPKEYLEDDNEVYEEG